MTAGAGRSEASRMAGKLRAAVIGASGIGRHHAKWYHLGGCEVVAFVGTSPESVKRTAETLRTTFGFDGRAYTDVAEMLEKERPDLLSVCSPPALHVEHANAALQAGVHVLCEKPLIWDWDLTGDQMLAEAQSMVALARQKGLHLATNTQYAAGIPGYLALYERERGPLTTVESFLFEMDSKGGGGQREWEPIWVELSSHSLAVLMKLVPDGVVDYGSVDCRIERKRTTAEFDYARADGSRVAVRISHGNIAEGVPPRRFGVNGFIVNYEGRNDENGVYCAFLEREGKEEKLKDFMQESLERFIAAVRGEGAVLCTGEEGLANLERQIRLLEHGRRA
jgi:predicted dehydrogenase